VSVCISPVLIKFKRGIQASVDNFYPDYGQVVLAIDTKRIFIGDVATPSGHDILIGNVSNLDKARYYGSNSRYIRGFHDLPSVVNIGPKDVEVIGTGSGVSLTSLKFNLEMTAVVPVLSFSKTDNQFINFTFKKLPSWNPDKELRMRVIFMTNAAITNDYNVKLLTRIRRLNLQDDPQFTLGLEFIYENFYEDTIDISKTPNWPACNAITLSNARIRLIDSNKEGEKITIDLQRDWENDSLPNDVVFYILGIQIYQPVNGTENAYFMGGGNLDDTAYIDSIEKLNFPFENALTYTINNLNIQKKNGGGCNSTTHGYCMGGASAATTFLSSIDRLNFSFDTARIQAIGTLTVNINGNSAFNCSTHGFSIGGETTYGTSISYIDRLEKVPFNIDTVFTRTFASLNTMVAFSNCVNSSSNGYIIGGYNTGYTYNMSKKMERITFPGDSGKAQLLGEVTILDSGENNRGVYGSHCCNSSTDGYIMGGYNVNTIFQFSFADPLVTTRTMNLVSSRLHGGGCNSSEYGFSSRGYTTESVFVNTIERMNFSMPGSTSVVKGQAVAIYGCPSVCDGTDFLTLFA